VTDTANGRTWLAETAIANIHDQATNDQYTVGSEYGGTRTYTYDTASRLTTTQDKSPPPIPAPSAPTPRCPHQTSVRMFDGFRGIAATHGIRGEHRVRAPPCAGLPSGAGVWGPSADSAAVRPAYRVASKEGTVVYL
jgi:hypothetical protein